ncbi:hypothetical protein QD460_31345 [Rhizobium jaguaris]|uniref:hypothetical protein n=1 Tax=Rhizobium jaguaris TaxID=1312183 RepID=UPI0039BF11C9
MEHRQLKQADAVSPFVGSDELKTLNISGAYRITQQVGQGDYAWWDGRRVIAQGSLALMRKVFDEKLKSKHLSHQNAARLDEAGEQTDICPYIGWRWHYIGRSIERWSS